MERMDVMKRYAFFDIIKLCHELDNVANIEGSHRVTRFYMLGSGVVFKVLHSEGGCVWAQAIELNEDHDLGVEIRKLHRIIDGRIKNDSRFIEDLRWPPPF